MSHPTSIFHILPGAQPFGSFLEIRIAEPQPLAWLAEVRETLTCMVEDFPEHAAPNGADTRAYAVRLLSWLYPLRSQWNAGRRPLSVPPSNRQDGGVWITAEGLALRFMGGAKFEELDAIVRALLTLGEYGGHQLTDPARAVFFKLLGALIPTTEQVAQFGLRMPIDRGRSLAFDRGEKQAGENVATAGTRRFDHLRRALDTPADRQNARFFAGLARLAALGKINSEDQTLLIEWVAVGLDAGDPEGE
ncbi:MAG: hypothetical protein U0U46_16260 [Saprospiraceae bacterium]